MLRRMPDVAVGAGRACGVHVDELALEALVLVYGGGGARHYFVLVALYVGAPGPVLGLAPGAVFGGVLRVAIALTRAPFPPLGVGG